MADQQQLKALRKGVPAWNAWRKAHPAISRPDLSEANLSGENLTRANLRAANLSKANLSKARLVVADLVGADLRGADLSGAILVGATLSGAKLLEAQLLAADLRRADLSGANLSSARLIDANLRLADLSGAYLLEAKLLAADLRRADLAGASLVAADLTDADLTGCRIYGVSAWRLELSEGTKQRDLIITDEDEPEVTVDNIEVAQFVYLLLHNEKIRDVIDTIGRKGVLLLGRFTGGRIAILERLRQELRNRGFVPMVFNFDRPETKDFTETVRLLAGLSHFVIVDITNPRSAPLELQATVPECMVPFVPIQEKGEEPFSMFKDLWIKHRAWVLEPRIYSSVERLVEGLDAKIIRPAQARFAELLAMKAEEMRVEDLG